MVDSNLRVNIDGENFDFTEIFDAMPRILALLSPKGKILRVNKLGSLISPIRYKLLGSSVWALPLWESNNEVKKIAQKSVRDFIDQTNLNANPVDLYFPVLDQNIRMNLYPILDNDQKLQYILIEGEKIEAIAKIEPKIILSEEKYRSLYDTDNDAIMIVDKDQGFLSGNPATIKMFRCQDEIDFISKSPAQLSPEFQPNGKFSADEAQKMMEIAMKMGAHYFDWVHKRTDDTLFFATVLLNRMELQGKTLLHARVRDITEKINNESQKNRLLEIIESSPNIISISDPEEHIIFMNQSGRKLLRWTNEDLSKYRVRDVLPDWAFKKILNIGMPYATKHSVWNGEIAILDFKGNEIPILQQIICHKSLSGKPEYFSSIMLDITDRKQYEGEQNRRQMIEAIALLAGGIAHDFNNLLTSILGNLSLLKVDESQSPENLDLINDAEKATIIASDLAKQLLTFSRTKKLVKENQNLAEIIQDSANFSIRGTDLTVKLDFEQDLWRVNGEKDQLSQVFLNLVLNAIQAKPKDGIIRISAENLRLTQDNTMNLIPGEYVFIMVRDRGEGISPENVNNIFNPYFTTKSTGIGLGLTITHAIINQHGGSIAVESQIGKGTIFSIYLPASEDLSIAPQESIKELPIDKLRGLKVLVLEDEPLIVSLIHNFCRKLHIDLNYSPNGHEIINSYRKAFEKNDPFDVVILDLTIRGGIGGEATIKELLKIDPEIKAIASSGYSKKPVMEEYQNYGFTSTLKKPYTYEKFVEKILNLIK